MRNSMLSGKSIGRKERVCGQIGVINKAGISGCTKDPPADNLIEKGLKTPIFRRENVPNMQWSLLVLKQ